MNGLLALNRGMFGPVAPATWIARDHEIFNVYQLDEEPRDKTIRGTRARFGAIVSGCTSPNLAHDVDSRNTATIATHKPDMLHRARGRRGEQSIVVVGEIKPMLSSVTTAESFRDFADDEVGQEMDFLQVCMTLQAWRQHMYGYLADCRRIEFFHATRDSSGVVRFERSGLYTDAEGWDRLNWLLNQPLDVLGFEDISMAGWTVDTFLGAGATSAVFSAKRAGSGDIAVCKMYLSATNGAEHRAREVRALQLLRGDPRVPTIVDGAPDCTTSERQVLLKTPVGRLLQSDVRLSIADYAPIVHTLQAAHAKDLYHNDVSPYNLFAVCRDDGSYGVMLNDFGSSTNSAELAEVNAGRRSIATRALFYADTSDRLAFGPAADLRALVRSLFYLTQCTFDPATVTTATRLDATMRSQIAMWGVALDLAENADYSALGTLLSTGLVTVTAAR